MAATHHSPAARKEFADKHINPKLRRSLRLYLAISAVVLIFVVVGAVRSHANGLIVSCGLLAGIVIGILFSRIYKISWDKDADHAINKTDLYGAALLILYIVFDLTREHLVTLFIHGNAVGATSLALLAGAFYGRVLGTGRSIIKVFREEKILPKLH